MKVKDLIKELEIYDDDLTVEVRGSPYLSKNGKIKSQFKPVKGMGFGWDTLVLSSEHKSCEMDQGD